MNLYHALNAIANLVQVHGSALPPSVKMQFLSEFMNAAQGAQAMQSEMDNLKRRVEQIEHQMRQLPRL